MRLALHIFSTFSLSLASRPCERLCDSDGPHFCTHGTRLLSDSHGERCYAYFRRLDGGHCYHSLETQATCPNTLPPLTPEEAEAIVQSRDASNTGAGSDEYDDLPVQPRVRRRIIPSQIPSLIPHVASPPAYVAPSSVSSGLSETSSQAPRRRHRCSPDGSRIAATSQLPAQDPAPIVQQVPVAEPTRAARRQRCFPDGVSFGVSSGSAVQEPAVRSVQRQSEHPHPGPLVRQTGTSHLAVHAHPPPAVVTSRSTAESIADAIGSAFLSRGDWSQFSVTISSLMSRLEIPAVYSLAEAADFWTRSNGADILASVIVADNCQGRDLNECFALMMLISHMPLPTNQDEALAFMTAHGIVRFVESHADSLANRLLGSEGNLLSAYVPGHLYGQIDIRGMGLLYGFAVSWSRRFPQIIAARPGLSRLVLRHALYRQMCAEPHSHDVASFRVLRRSALQSSTNELMRYSGPVLRKGVDEVRYEGEDGFGVGLRQEWFALMAEAIVGPVFKTREGSGVLQLDISEDTIPDNLRAVGRYFALCIIQGRPTGLNLPVGFFKLLAGQPVSVEDSREIDETYFRSLRQYVGEISSMVFESLIFGMEGEPLAGSGATEELTMANKDAQVIMVVENLIMNSNRPAFNLLVEGFTSVIPRSVLRTVSAEDVKRFIYGNARIDAVEFFNDIDFVHSTSTWTPERIEWIRQIITSFNQERLSKLLRFVTGFQVLPFGGFPALGRIQFKAFPATHPLPTAHTCFKSLDMPQYATFEDTRRIFTDVVDFGNFAGMTEALDTTTQQLMTV